METTCPVMRVIPVRSMNSNFLQRCSSHQILKDLREIRQRKRIVIRLKKNKQIHTLSLQLQNTVLKQLAGGEKKEELNDGQH